MLKGYDFLMIFISRWHGKNKYEKIQQASPSRPTARCWDPFPTLSGTSCAPAALWVLAKFSSSSNKSHPVSRHVTHLMDGPNQWKQGNSILTMLLRFRGCWSSEKSTIFHGTFHFHGILNPQGMPCVSEQAKVWFDWHTQFPSSTPVKPFTLWSQPRRKGRETEWRDCSICEDKWIP